MPQTKNSIRSASSGYRAILGVLILSFSVVGVLVVFEQRSHAGALAKLRRLEDAANADAARKVQQSKLKDDRTQGPASAPANGARLFTAILNGAMSVVRGAVSRSVNTEEADEFSPPPQKPTYSNVLSHFESSKNRALKEVDLISALIDISPAERSALLARYQYRGFSEPFNSRSSEAVRKANEQSFSEILGPTKYREYQKAVEAYEADKSSRVKDDLKAGLRRRLELEPHQEKAVFDAFESLGARMLSSVTSGSDKKLADQLRTQEGQRDFIITELKDTLTPTQIERFKVCSKDYYARACGTWKWMIISLHGD